MAKSRLTELQLTFGNKLLRRVWNLVWICFFRLSPSPMFFWRRFLLRVFGAKIDKGVIVYPSVRVWAPWNLEMGPYSCLSHFVDCYSVAPVKLGARVTVSQYGHLCTASHDFRKRSMPLIVGQIVIGDDAWLTADVFVGPGVSIGSGSVIAARSTVVRDVDDWVVVAGNPAKVVATRKFID